MQNITNEGGSPLISERVDFTVTPREAYLVFGLPELPERKTAGGWQHLRRCGAKMGVTKTCFVSRKKKRWR